MARELEALGETPGVRPTADFSDRVMAAIEREPVPQPAVALGSALRRGRIGLAAAAIGDAWRVAFGGGRPFAARAQALALVLVVAVARDRGRAERPWSGRRRCCRPIDRHRRVRRLPVAVAVAVDAAEPSAVGEPQPQPVGKPDGDPRGHRDARGNGDLEAGRDAQARRNPAPW